MAGNNPAAHHSRPAAVVSIVRRFLHAKPDGTPRLGPASILNDFNEFKTALAQVAMASKLTLEETDPFRDDRSYLTLLTEFLKSA